jgi:biotin synthase
MPLRDLCDYRPFAEKAIAGEALTREEARSVLETPDERVLELLGAAFVVRQRFFGRKVRLQMLQNAKSGACQEDCGYCSQSKISTANIAHYGLLSKDEMVQGAQRAAASKAIRYCIVIGGRGPLDREISAISEAVRQIKGTIPIQVCCSLGLLTESDARRLREAGVDRINHNLNSSERYHPEIVTTHTYQDRLATIKNARAAGLEICSGGIAGMGETDEDLIDLALALREVAPHSIPMNFLHPVEGTPMENRHELTPQRCLKVLCLFRFLHPRTELRVAGGREFNLRSLQPLALYAADSLFVGGYLTTPGMPAQEAWTMIGDLGFEVDQGKSGCFLADAGLGKERLSRGKAAAS